MASKLACPTNENDNKGREVTLPRATNPTESLGASAWSGCSSYSVRQDGTRTRLESLHCTTASRLGVSDNHDAGIADEPASTSTVRLRGLSTSTMKSDAMHEQPRSPMSQHVKVTVRNRKNGPALSGYSQRNAIIASRHDQQMSFIKGKLDHHPQSPLQAFPDCATQCLSKFSQVFFRAVDSTQVKVGESRASCAWFCYRVVVDSVESLEEIATRHVTNCKRPSQYSEADHERYLLSQIVTSKLVQSLAMEQVGHCMRFSSESVQWE
jgi:hypothetical protein